VYIKDDLRPYFSMMMMMMLMCKYCSTCDRRVSGCN